MTTSFSKHIQITRKKILNYNDKDKLTYYAKSLQIKINLHFFEKMKNDEIRNNILRLM